MLWSLLSVVGYPLNGRAQDSEIIAAVKAGLTSKVKGMLEANPSLVNARDSEWNSTPLNWAADGGNAEIAKLLITSRANVNAVNKDGYTPLHFAAMRGHAEVAKLLIASGANVNAVQKDEIAPLHQAANKGHVEIAKLLIASGADVNAVSLHKLTPLHWAAWQVTIGWDVNWLIGRAEVIKLLIAKGANTLAKDESGRQAIDLAREKGFGDIVSILEKYPHDCDQCRGRGKIDRSEEASRTERRCYRCAGKGEVLCDSRYGWPHSDDRYKDGAQIICPKCRGNRHVECPVCSGSGVIVDTKYRNWTDVCTKCRGTGILPVKTLAPDQPVRPATPTRRPVTKRKP
jgi:hypothetical protein